MAWTAACKLNTQRLAVVGLLIEWLLYLVGNCTLSLTQSTRHVGGVNKGKFLLNPFKSSTSQSPSLPLIILLLFCFFGLLFETRRTQDGHTNTSRSRVFVSIDNLRRGHCMLGYVRVGSIGTPEASEGGGDKRDDGDSHKQSGQNEPKRGGNAKLVSLKDLDTAVLMDLNPRELIFTERLGRGGSCNVYKGKSNRSYPYPLPNPTACGVSALLLSFTLALQTQFTHAHNFPFFFSLLVK